MSIVLGGIRDPELIGQIDSWLELLREKVTERTTAAYGSAAADCLFTMRVYGKNGVLGKAEPLKDTVSHELMLIMEATAPTQEMATSIASSARHIGLHLPIPQWKAHLGAGVPVHAGAPRARARLPLHSEPHPGTGRSV